VKSWIVLDTGDMAATDQQIGYGDGNGYGYGNGYGDGNGYGYGKGDGNGNGNGYGYGNGDGNGYGYGNGDGDGKQKPPHQRSKKHDPDQREKAQVRRHAGGHCEGSDREDAR
jgi:hypothetical protein